MCQLIHVRVVQLWENIELGIGYVLLQQVLRKYLTEKKESCSSNQKWKNKISRIIMLAIKRKYIGL